MRNLFGPLIAGVHKQLLSNLSVKIKSIGLVLFSLIAFDLPDQIVLPNA